MLQWLKNRWYTHQYYKITKTGEQCSMMDNVEHEYILHIYNDGKIRYHFIKKGQPYKIVYPYRILGMSIKFNQRTYIVPPHSFILQNNEFTEPVQLWLCKHYLYISPSCQGLFTLIDDMAVIRNGNFLHINNTLEKDIKYIE
jgi:hypothetical protein